MYDADDLRIFKGTVSGSSVNNRMEYYLKDIAVYDMTTNTWTYYVSTNERIAKIIPLEDQVPGDNVSNTNFTLKLTQLSFYETDHLGNTRIVFSPEKFNADGSILRKIHFAADYYPYGKTLRYFETSAFEEKFLTTQHERDRETGFDYRGARYYDSDLGRFLSVDPLAHQAPGWSPYRAFFCNPIYWTDPDGRFETRKEARQYKKEHGIEAVVRKDDDGRFNLSNKYTGEYWQKGSQWERNNGLTNNEGILKGAFVYHEKKPNKNSDNGVYIALGVGINIGELARQAKAYQFFGSSAQASDEALSLGKYIHNGETYFQGNYKGVTNPMTSSLGTAKVVKTTGRAISGANIVVTGYQVTNDISEGRYYSAGTRAMVAGAAAGAAFIPVVGWGVSIGIGIADAIWGDDFYDYVEKTLGE